MGADTKITGLSETLEPQTDIVLDVRGLSKKYRMSSALSKSALKLNSLSRSESKDFWALKNISFTVKSGERVGIMGHNGAGKSTLLKILSRVVSPTEGEAFIHGRSTSLLEVGTGFNPELTGRQNVYLNAALHGLKRDEVDDRMDAIIEFSEIGRFIEEPVGSYSTGMRARLGFSVAAYLDPDILMLDEVLSVGDASFQKKCLVRMESLTGHGRTILFVSHSTGTIRRFCDRCIWLSNGEIVMDGLVNEVCEAYEAKMLDVSSSYQIETDSKPPLIPPISHQAKSAISVTDDSSEGLLKRIEEVDKVCELVSAQVLDKLGQPARSLKITEDCFVEIVYDVFYPNLRVEPALHVKNDQNEMLFVVAFTDGDYEAAIISPGRYKSRVHIQGNLLNEGLHFITICLVTADPLVRHQIVDNAISFSVYELIGDVTKVARGRYARAFPGGLRPFLNWKTEKLKQ